MPVQKGDNAPEFSLPASGGSTVSLKALAGRNITLYVYPRDNTPGCTQEACNFRGNHTDLEQPDAVVPNVNKDNVTTHQGFGSKQALPFRLLSDADSSVALAYRVWSGKKHYVHTFIDMYRTAFLNDTQGRLVKTWPKAKSNQHGARILAAIKDA